MLYINRYLNEIFQIEKKHNTVIDYIIIDMLRIWINVCNMDAQNNDKLVAIDYNDKKILVTIIHDKIYATDRICTHQYADLSAGFLNEEEKL